MVKISCCVKNVRPEISGLPVESLPHKVICMNTQAREAAEQLRMIRKLMERATIYRALTGETALIGGALALLAAWGSERKYGFDWVAVWLIGLGLAVGFHIFQLWRASRANQSASLWSSGLKTALRCALPSFVAGGILGVLACKFISPLPREMAACFWITHYGIALLSIREFTPKSMVWLGWAFVIFGVAVFYMLFTFDTRDVFQVKFNGSRLMAIAFGGFHMIYGALIVTTKAREEQKSDDSGA